MRSSKRCPRYGDYEGYFAPGESPRRSGQLDVIVGRDAC